MFENLIRQTLVTPNFRHLQYTVIFEGNENPWLCGNLPNILSPNIPLSQGDVLNEHVILLD